MKTKSFKPKTLAKNIALLAKEKKGQNIVILDVSKISTFCNYFVIITGTVSTHINTLFEYIKTELKKRYGIIPAHTEGERFYKWVILDYGSVIVHIMTPQLREFYALERIWFKGKIVSYETKTKKNTK